MDRKNKVMKIKTAEFPVVFLIIFLSGSVVEGKDIVECSETGLVKKSWVEEKREEIASVFGDLTKYDLFWIRPEGELEVIAIRREETNGEDLVRISWWRHGMRKNNIISKVISDDKFNHILNLVKKLFAKANNGSFNESGESVDETSKANQGRVFLYKRIKNVDVWDWRCVSIRSNSKDRDFGLLRNNMMQAVDVPTEKEVKEFLDD